MKYDFETLLDRKGMDAIAYEPPMSFTHNVDVSKTDIIPMWVADMNFKTLPDISEAIIKRASHPLFGYFTPKEEYFNNIINWQKIRNNIEVKKENIGYENGVLGGVASVIKALNENDAPILLHSPTYIGFTHTLDDNNIKIVHSPLIKQDNKWVMNYEDMDKKIKENRIKIAIFCNPHNPCGRVWDKQEILKAYEVYERNNVIVISDEIWSDIILFNNKHIPSASVSEYAHNNTITLYAPSKTFNLAGLIGSYHVIYNLDLKKKIDTYEASTHYNSMNVLSMHAAIAAFNDNGAKWVDELREVLSINVDYAYNFIKDNFKGLELFKPEGTYMLYVECDKWLKESNKTLDDLLIEAYKLGVIIQDGRPFNLDNTIRINLALPTYRIKEAFNRLNTIFNKVD